MTRYIAMLRGINLGNHNRIAMPALRDQFVSLGLEKVATYVQSGNVIFDSTMLGNTELAEKIKIMIQKQLSYEVPVIIKSAKEMEKIVAGNPFLTREEMDTTNLYVTFLGGLPAHDLIAALLESLGGADEWALSDTQIYLYCPNGYGRTKLTNNLFESKLKVVATTRNWKTVTALAEMAKTA